MKRTAITLVLLAVVGLAAAVVGPTALSGCSGENVAPCTPKADDGGDAAACPPPVTPGGGGGGGGW